MIKVKYLTSFLIALALVSFGTVSFAQLSVGGHVGLNLANLHGSSIENNNMIVGMNIGGIVNYSGEDILSGDLADILSGQVELSIQTKGTNFKYEDENFSFEAKQKFTYVEIPILAKGTFETGSDLKYFGEAGFFAGALFGVTVDGEKAYDTDDDDSTDPRKFREDYSGFDFGVKLGGGASYPIEVANIPLEVFGKVRYSLGLSNIGEFKEKTDPALEESLKSVKTNTINILFGVMYKL